MKKKNEQPHMFTYYGAWLVINELIIKCENALEWHLSRLADLAMWARGYLPPTERKDSNREIARLKVLIKENQDQIKALKAVVVRNKKIDRLSGQLPTTKIGNL
jgi:hypothetical protein